MTTKSYRLKMPTVAIVKVDGQPIQVTVPKNGMVSVAVGLSEGAGAGFVNVEWDGKAATMMTRDLLDHGELVEKSR